MAEREPHSTLADFVFTTPLRVRWAEVDMQGIVFNPHYLTYADVAMTEYMRAVGFPYPEALLPFGADIFAVNANVDFRSSARFDDALTLAVRTQRIGRTSMLFRIAVFRGEDLLCDVRNTYVCATPQAQKPVPVPQVFIDAVLAYERTPPER
ncbi:MAG TPA: thioesterase family protein [Caulobacter sp.]|nr:thioesterase family protein [Caulobacter sp.]